MRIVNAATTALVGIVAAGLLAPLAPDWPTAAIGAGAVVAGGILLVRPGGRKHYALSGVGYTLGLAVTVHLLGRFPPAYEGTALVALALFGLLGAFLLALKIALGRIVRRIGSRYFEEGYVRAVYDAVASAASLLTVVWTVMTIHEKAARYGGVGVAGAGTLTLDYIGVQFPVGAWLLGEGVDVVVVLFVGCTLGFFHVLESLHTTWIATKKTASASAAKGKTAARKGKQAGATVAERAGDGEEE